MLRYSFDISTIQSTPFGITGKSRFWYSEYIDYQYLYHSQFASSSTDNGASSNGTRRVDNVPWPVRNRLRLLRGPLLLERVADWMAISRPDDGQVPEHKFVCLLRVESNEAGGPRWERNQSCL